MKYMHTLMTWHQTKLGLSVFIAVELLIAYGFVSMAIDRGNLWWYLITFLLIVSSVHNFIKLARTFFS